MNDLRTAAQNLVDKLLAEFGWSPGEFPAVDELRAQLARPDPVPVGEVQYDRSLVSRYRVKWLVHPRNFSGAKLYAMPQSLAPECNETTES